MTPPTPDEVIQRTMDCLERNGGNQTRTARELGISRHGVQSHIYAAEKRGISTITSKLETLHGWNPDHDLTKTVPSPLVLRGTSSLYKDGELKLQWVKTRLDDSKVEAAIRASIEALAESIPKAEKVKQPEHTEDKLCNLYTLTDCHVGMKAWAKETGEDWDLQIAEQTLTKAFDYLLDASPSGAIGIVNQLGDWLHYDSLTAITPTSGHMLDADSRFPKMVQISTRILRYVITKALEKHKQVVVLIAEGNHDMASSVWLRHLFGLLYENEPRVKVLDSDRPYFCHIHGVNMLAFHHGHLKKNDQLPLLFASMYPEEWGKTTKRVCHTGHRHHEEIKEHNGMKVQQHATLAASDAYASRGGWIADRQIVAITYHKDFGQVSSITVCPEMLE